MRKSSNLIFIHHPNYFKEESLKGKIGLIYIFNSKQLYNKLSQKYKCVNLGVDGNISDENFFPKRKMSEESLSKIFDFKMGIYSYFKKKYYQIESKYYVKRGGYKDSEYRFVADYSYNLYRKNKINGILYLEDELKIW